MAHGKQRAILLPGGPRNVPMDARAPRHGFPRRYFIGGARRTSVLMRPIVVVPAVTLLLLAVVPSIEAATLAWSVQYVRGDGGRMDFLARGVVVPATCPSGWGLGALASSAPDDSEVLHVEGYVMNDGGLHIRHSRWEDWSIQVFGLYCENPSYSAPDTRLRTDAAPLAGPWHANGASALVTAPDESTWTLPIDASGANCLRVVSEPAQPRPFATNELPPAAAQFPFTGTITLKAHTGDFTGEHVAGTYVGGVGPFDLPRGLSEDFEPAGSIASTSTGPAWCDPSLGDGFVVATVAGILGMQDAWGTWAGLAQVCNDNCA